MFDDLYDALSLVWSSRWPKSEGEITAVEAERVRHNRREEMLRLAIAYKFSVGEDGPYTGESFWSPNFFVKKRIIAARRKFRLRQRVTVRYRSDDPSVNKLDSSVWKGL